MRLIIPDFRVLNQLSRAGRMHVLMPRVTITDVAGFCANSQVMAFIREHTDAVIIDRTGFYEQIKLSKADPNFPLPADISELSIYGYLNEIARSETDTQAVIILDDGWFDRNQAGTMPPGVQLLTLTAYLAKKEAAQ
jgi:hypothetical protein